MKHRTYDGALTTMCIFLFLAIGCGVAGLCLIHSDVTLWTFPLKYCFAVACGAFFAVYLVTGIVCIITKHGHRMLGLSVVVVLMSTVLIALSPVAFIVWIFQTIYESIVEKRANSNKI